ncbi:hypothetical protein A9R05_42540 (plasmid) [Burkholderia sp. KK1]|uniref:helix-turn-helix domain-containing protein n=1 Tax=Burkholderia TaxID=32008 RepID=UPI000979A43C|nr:MULTISPECIES: helix-turn-helix domain-containing protein [Burkholderia]AQH05700.1 hypothetical protein A9R05_42540 [Burkholderia sp. KK1]
MNHCERLLTHLERTGPITPMEAWSELGIYRLGARIFDLKAQGHEIVREIVAVSNRYGEECRVARYRLVPPVGLHAVNA